MKSEIFLLAIGVMDEDFLEQCLNDDLPSEIDFPKEE
jgi:hypothetical protein